MKTGPMLLVAVLATSLAMAQTNRPAGSPARSGAGKAAPASGPDPDLFDGTKFDRENRPDEGMLGEFEMPGSNDPQDKSKVGGNPGQAGGQQNQPPKDAAGGGAASAPSASAGGAGGAESANAGSASAGGGASSEKSGSSGAAGGASDQGKSGQSGGSGPSGKAEGMQADQLKGGSSSAPQSAAQGAQGKASSGKIGSAELRIEPLPESDKDVIGREAAAGGTQGSNRAMPSGGATGSTNQNKGVEKGKVMPKGL